MRVQNALRKLVKSPEIAGVADWLEWDQVPLHKSRKEARRKRQAAMSKSAQQQEADGSTVFDNDGRCVIISLNSW